MTFEFVTDGVQIPGTRADSRNARLAILAAEIDAERADLLRRAADGDAHARQKVALAAMSSATSRDSAKLRLRDHSRETAEWCGDCGRELSPEEAVWRDHGTYSSGVVGTCCRPPSLDGRTSQPCEACGRPVHARWWSEHPACSERCRADALTARRRTYRAAARSGRTCEVCGGTFDPPRSDARYCSPACRQRAYRARRSGGDR